MAENQMDDRALDRFLNDLATGQASAGGYDDLDPALIEAMNELRTLAQIPPPDPMRERVTNEVELAIERLAGEGGASTQRLNGAPPRAALGPGPGFPRGETGSSISRSSRAIAFPRRLALVAAALLVLLGAGYVLLGSGLLDDDQPNTVPAAVVPTATPTPDVRSEGKVVEVTIPAAVLPAGVAGYALDHNTILPGTQSTWTVPQNAILRYVVAGTLTVRSDTPVSVLRAGAPAWTDVARDTEVELGPGDAMLFLNATTAEFANAGATPVEMVGWIIASGTESDGPVPPEWVNNDYALSGAGAVSLTGGPAVLRLQRMVLAPGDTIPAAPKGVLQLVIDMPDNGAGTPVAAPIVVGLLSGETANYGADPTLVYMITLTFVASEASPAVGTPPP